MVILICITKGRHICTDPEGGGAGGSDSPPPLENHKDIGFLSNTGLDPLKNHKANKPALDHPQAREILFKWRFTGGPLMAR